MNIGQLLLIWIGSHTQRFINDYSIWGIGIFGAEPDSPRPPLPSAPPIHPCPYRREAPSYPFL